jgi:hypothetical protein
MADVNPWLIGAGVGSNVLGAVLQNRQANRQNEQTAMSQERLYQLAQQEQQRRDMLTRAILPQMGRTLGNPGLAQLGSTYGQIGGNSNMGQGGGLVPQTPGSSAGKALGIGGAGLGMASAAGLGALGGPPGMAATGALLGGKYIANQVGKGRRTANLATGEGGHERQFDEAMAEAVRRRDAGDIEGAKQILQQGYAAFMQGNQAFQAQGGNHAKVANQAMNSNKPKWDTYQSIAQSLGVR